MAKAMKDISSGAQKWEGEKWFAELSAKRMYTSNPLLVLTFLKNSSSFIVCYIKNSTRQVLCQSVSFILLGIVGLQQNNCIFCCSNTISICRGQC